MDLMAMLNSSQHTAQGNPGKKSMVVEALSTRTFDELGREQSLVTRPPCAWLHLTTAHNSKAARQHC